MSYARMSEKQKVLAGQVSALLAEAEQIDHDEDAEFGRDNKGYGLPAELARRESRLAKITEAKAALETEAKGRAAAQAQQRARAAGKDEDTVALRAAAAGLETGGATQLHRSRVQDHEDRRRVVPPVLQRPGCGR